MNCPACDKNLTGVNFRDIAAYKCGSCCGFWLSNENLTSLNLSIHNKFSELEIGSSSRYCPTCKCNMRMVTFSGVELDFCGECKGIWFDADEISKLSPDPNSGVGGYIKSGNLGTDVKDGVLTSLIHFVIKEIIP